MTCRRLLQYCLNVLWPVLNSLNLKYELFPKIFYWISSAVFVFVIFQQFVHFNHLFVVKYQKFLFCGTYVVKMENYLGARII